MKSNRVSSSLLDLVIFVIKNSRIIKSINRMKISTSILILILALFFNSCKKQNKEECSGNPDPISLSSNSPVIAGWPLVLTASNYENGYSYRWKGPNGWSAETSFGNNNYEPYKITKDSVSVTDSGTYHVELIQDGCVIGSGSVNVQVIEPPLPPCSISNNSSTTTLGGVGGVTYSVVSHSGGINYSVYATNGSQTINFTFNDGEEPKPGMYLVEGGYYPSEKDHVSVYIQAGFYDFFMESYYTVYVNKVNGKLQFSFCNGHFSNPVGSTPVIISAKVTLP